jgi:hypothetical protein
MDTASSTGRAVQSALHVLEQLAADQPISVAFDWPTKSLVTRVNQDFRKFNRFLFDRRLSSLSNAVPKGMADSLIRVLAFGICTTWRRLSVPLTMSEPFRRFLERARPPNSQKDGLGKLRSRLYDSFVGSFPAGASYEGTLLRT